jgi:serine/threonine-protein kinase
MTPERYQQVNRLLDELLELSPEDRAPHLSAACAEDEELRCEVESLLKAYDQAQSFIEAPAAGEAAELLNEQKAGEMIGRTLGHYRLRSLLGAGGMGEVYRATDMRLEREVAIKILTAHLAQDAEALRRFEREAKAVAALSHPNVCAIHDFGIEQGVTYAVMELLEGETLRQRLGRSTPPWREAAQIGVGVADGLVAAHAKGIIHRDLKPENIFLTSGGQVKVLDFGIARVKRLVSPEAETGTGTMTETTKPGTMIGTIGYMSPEQVRGEAVEATSDIFSLGCVLYEMVSGERPFGRVNTMETLAAILKEKPPSLTNAGKKIPAQVERVIRHCLEKHPTERYPSARELASDLHALLSREKSPLLAPALSKPHLRPLWWVGIATIALLLGIAVWWYLVNRRAPVIDSLAVMPLVNLSGDAEIEYLGDGVTEGLINNLSQIPSLRVIARSTVFSYKGKEVDPRKIGRELNVRAILTGSVAQRGDTLRIKTELVNADDGSQLWNEQYDRKLTEIVSVQTEIVQQISERLRLRLTEQERRRLTKHHTESAEAHRLYLKGRYYWNNWTGGDIKKGLQYFEQALAEDPAYSLAYVGLADAYYGLAGLYMPSKQAMPKMRGAALKALELDDTLAEAHTSLALVRGFYEWNWAEAEKEFQRAIELSPGYATAHYGYGLYLLIQERPEEALREMRLAEDFDPLSPSIAVTATWPFYYAPPPARRYDQAIARLRNIIDLNPNFPPAHSFLGNVYLKKEMVKEAIAEFDRARRLEDTPWILAYIGLGYAVAGKRAEARQVLAELDQISKGKHVSPIFIARIYAGLGEKDQAFAWLQKGYEEKEEEIILTKVDPAIDSLRSDPRFTDLLRRLNLAP